MPDENTQTYNEWDTPAPSDDSETVSPPPLAIAQPPLYRQASMARFTVNGSLPLARILDATVSLYASPDPGAEVIGSLSSGDLVELQKVWKTNGGWVEVRGENNSFSYMPGGTKCAFLQRTKMKDKDVVLTVNTAPGDAPLSPIPLTKGSLFWLEANKADASTVIARLDTGVCGTIPATVKVVTLPQLKVTAIQAPTHNIFVGLAWCVGGGVITYATYSSVAQSGGTYLICWGPMLFGGIQFLKGLFSLGMAEKPPRYSAPGSTPRPPGSR